MKKHKAELGIGIKKSRLRLRSRYVRLRRETANRKRAEKALTKRLTYEKMLAKISNLAAMNGNIDDFQVQCLEIMGKALDVCRVYIFEYDADTDTLNNTFEWVVDGISREKNNLQMIPVSSFPWWMDRMQANQIINYKNLRNIPGEHERQFLEKQRIRSILVVPFFVCQKFYGFIGFDECRHMREWAAEDVMILSTVSQIISRYIEVRRSEKALLRFGQKYQLLVENANDAIFIVQDVHISYHNKKTEDLTGYTAEELAEIPFLELIHPDERHKINPNDLKKRKVGSEDSAFMVRLIDKSGQEIIGSMHSIGTTWKRMPAILCFFRDMTLQKQLEFQLVQSQKMEAIGTLASGIAHDFNNLLMGIQGYASLMLVDMLPEDQQYQRIKNIEQYVSRGAELTRQLLGFAREGKYKVRPTDINEMIGSTSRMFERAKKELRIHRKYEKNLWTVEIDPGQIERVLLNLYVNAWQAMPEGGDLYLETCNVNLDEKMATCFDVEAGRYVKIVVTDTGCGMDETTRKRVFEPFFTTKEMGRGTGLGLASAYGIIKNHHGVIKVSSEEGKGTSFVIYLPATRKMAQSEIQTEVNLRSGRETILLVDDEEMFLDVGSQLLEKMNYRVLTAQNGEDAIRIYKENQDRIGMVILDLIMVGMSGKDVCRYLKNINPDVRILISSGCIGNIGMDGIDGMNTSDFISKPFKIDQLSLKIRQILDR